MALSYTRILCGRNLGVNSFRSLYTSRNLAVSTTSKSLEKVAVHENHDEKNMRLGRPMSPHLTIYQFQVTSMLSISHRATGMIMSGYAAILGFSTIFVPGGMPCMIEGIHAMCLPAAVILLSKAVLAFPVTFHFFNGIRHLAWDLGMFLTIKDVYTTGYVMIGTAALFAGILALL